MDPISRLSKARLLIFMLRSLTLDEEMNYYNYCYYYYYYCCCCCCCYYYCYYCCCCCV